MIGIVYGFQLDRALSESEVQKITDFINQLTDKKGGERFAPLLPEVMGWEIKRLHDENEELKAKVAKLAKENLINTGPLPYFNFEVHDRVEKYTGAYKLEGVVVARFLTIDGEKRYVVEHRPLAPGMLHIYGPNNLRLMS